MNALVIGGTRGIGKAVNLLLQSKGWRVIAYGRRDYNIISVSNGDYFRMKNDASLIGGYDAFVFSAGDLNARGIDAFKYPMTFYNLVSNEIGLFNKGCVIVAIGSVAATRPAKLNPHYAAAKSALLSYILTLQQSEKCQRNHWAVREVRFDLVEGTDMYTVAISRMTLEELSMRHVIKLHEAAWRVWSVIEDARGE